VITSIGGNLTSRVALSYRQMGRSLRRVALGDRGSDFGLARYNSNGTLDTSFGINGIVTTDFGGSFEGAWSVALQTDGKIVAAGLTVIGGINQFALARYNSDGTLDANFGTGGRVTTVFAGASIANAFSVALQLDGKIVVAGWTNIDGGADFALARYDSTGTLDTSFGTGGRVITAFADSQGCPWRGCFPWPSRLTGRSSRLEMPDSTEIRLHAGALRQSRHPRCQLWHGWPSHHRFRRLR
jgi:uncharacterized delta-60 repeat protein